MITSYFTSPNASPKKRKEPPGSDGATTHGKAPPSPAQKASIETKTEVVEKKRRLNAIAPAVADDKDTEGKDTLDIEVETKEGKDFDNLELLLHASWSDILKGEFTKPYWPQLKSFLGKLAAKNAKILPPRELIFTAFDKCTFDKVRVVIIGQDPYPAPGQAEGMSFSVPMGVKTPSSLRNIYKELSTDIKGFTVPKHGHLMGWAEQGVLMLNTVLTVTQAQVNSHSQSGWSNFTDAVIDVLNKQKTHLVFFLWGAHAQKKAKRLNESKHYVLKCPHPSGLSASKGFFGCKHFSKCNSFLKKNGLPEIGWQV